MSRINERLNTLRAQGIDTSNYFVLTNQFGEGVLMQWENGIPKVVEESGDAILDSIISDGYVRNSKLHRRFVLAQAYTMINDKDGFDGYLRRLGYKYQWKTLLDELKVLGKLEIRDRETFEIRNHFYTRDVCRQCVYHYKCSLKELLDTLKVRRCKGKPYVRIGGSNIFVADIEKKIFEIIKATIIKIDTAVNYNDIYEVMSEFYKSIVKKYKLPFDTPFEEAWVQAYKGAGGYYSLRNLIQFHNCGIKMADGILITGTSALSEIDSHLSEYEGCGYKYLGMLKACIRDNNWTPNWN